MPVTYGEIVEAIDPSTQVAATSAELKRRGEGVRYILQKLRLGSPKGETNG
jgi:hypothetical protein